MFNRINNNYILNFMAECFLITFCIIPGIVLSFKTLQSPWTLFRLARANISLQSDHLATFITSATGYRAEHIGSELVQATLLDATGWTPESIALLPLGSLLLALLYYGISKNIARSSWTAAAITIYTSWYYPSLYSQFGTQTYVWAHTLFLSFLLILWYWLRKRTAFLSLLLMMVFTASFFHYHSTPLWMISILFFVTLFYKIRNYSNPSDIIPISSALPLFCFVLYFSFDTVIYGNALVRLKKDAIGESFLHMLSNKIIAPLISRNINIMPPFEVAPVGSSIAKWTTLMILILLTVPVFVWCAERARIIIRNKSISELFKNKEDIFVLSIVAAALTHISMYSLYGTVSFRVIPVAFPILIPLVTKRLKQAQKINIAITSMLAILAIVGFISFSSNLLPDTIASDTGLASKLLKDNSVVLSDASLYGSLLTKTTSDEKIIDLAWLDSDKYTSLVSGLAPEKTDYIATNITNRPIISSHWLYYEPWIQHIDDISNNKKLNKIYASDNLIMFQPEGFELPIYTVKEEDVFTIRPPIFKNMFYLFIAVVGTFFLPGTIFLFITQYMTGFKIDNINALTALIVGLSITLVTFFGYLVNFSPLPLSYIYQLSLLVPVMSLILFITKNKQQSFRNILPQYRYPAVIITVLLIWSVASSQVYQGILARNGEYTEFFITKDETNPSQLYINIVNRLKETQNATIQIKMDGHEIEEIGSQEIASNSYWSKEWAIPADYNSQKIEFILHYDQKIISKLHTNQLKIPPLNQNVLRSNKND